MYCLYSLITKNSYLNKGFQCTMTGFNVTYDLFLTFHHARNHIKAQRYVLDTHEYIINLVC